jgi:hypothetical protein
MNMRQPDGLPDVLRQLREPFPPEALSWKPGAVAADKGRCQALAFADLRAYMDRLDAVCGLDWSVRYVPWQDRLICELTIGGVTRSSTGEPDAGSAKQEIGGTVCEAQAFKRACTMFGLGRYLYELPSVWVDYDAQRKRITDTAITELNTRYSAWFARYQAQQQRKPAT